MSRRNSSWFNGSSYYDPTAGAAIDNILREDYRKKQKERKRIEREAAEKKRVPHGPRITESGQHRQREPGKAAG